MEQVADRFLSKSEVRERLGDVSDNFLAGLVRDGHLTRYPVGPRVARFLESEVTEYIRRTVQAARR